MTPAEHDWVAASRAAAGLPPHVDDPAVLEAVVALLESRSDQQLEEVSTGASSP